MNSVSCLDDRELFLKGLVVSTADGEKMVNSDEVLKGRDSRQRCGRGKE